VPELPHEELELRARYDAQGLREIAVFGIDLLEKPECVPDTAATTGTRDDP